MKKNIINITELVKGILTIFAYFFIASLLSIPFSFLIESNKIPLDLATFLLYLLLALIFIIIYHKDLIKDFKSFKKDYKKILKVTSLYWLIGIFIMIVSSFIINMFHIDTNANQEANIELLKSMPIVEFLCAVIFAPITEELVFRKSFKNISSNKHIYALSTGIIFGLVHVTSSLSGIESLIMLLYLIPYSALGIAFGYAYKKTDNIYGTIFIHAIHNVISLLQLIIIGGLL